MGGRRRRRQVSPVRRSVIVIKHLSRGRGAVVMEMLPESLPKLVAVLVVKRLNGWSSRRTLGGSVWRTPFIIIIIIERRQRTWISVWTRFRARRESSICSIALSITTRGYCR